MLYDRARAAQYIKVFGMTTGHHIKRLQENIQMCNLHQDKLKNLPSSMFDCQKERESKKYIERKRLIEREEKEREKER